jgi:hypothetical protein
MVLSEDTLDATFFLILGYLLSLNLFVGIALGSCTLILIRDGERESLLVEDF